MRIGGGQQQRRGTQDEEFDEIAKGVCGGCCVLVVVAVLLSILTGFKSIEVNEIGLNYSLLNQKADKKAFGSGRYFVGPFNYFVRFPAVVRTIQFSDAGLRSDLQADETGGRMLRSRTSDGLDVSLEISFQYQIMPERLYDLYVTLDENPHFHNVYVRIAMSRLTELATNFSATQFFVARTVIGRAFYKSLKAEFERDLFASIFSFQLRSVHLPKAFEDAIQETEVMKQDLQVAMAEQNATKVSLQTMLMQAERRIQVKTAQGQAQAQSTMLSNSADIAQYTATQHKAADSYSKVEEALDGKPAEVLAYMETRVLRDHPSELTTVGLENPQDLLQVKKKPSKG